MRIPILLTLVISISACAVQQPASQQPPPPKASPQQAAFSFCSEPRRGESFSGPLAPEAVPPEVSILAEARYRDQLRQDPPGGAWYAGSERSYLFCSYRLNNPKACGSEKRFYRRTGDTWAPAEHDMMTCG